MMAVLRPTIRELEVSSCLGVLKKTNKKKHKPTHFHQASHVHLAEAVDLWMLQVLWLSLHMGRAGSSAATAGWQISKPKHSSRDVLQKHIHPAERPAERGTRGPGGFVRINGDQINGFITYNLGLPPTQ